MEIETIKMGRTKAVIFAIFCITFLVAFFFLRNLVDGNPIVADGFQNLTISKNLVGHHLFSVSDAEFPNSDMQREPAWPAVTAVLISVFSLNSEPVDVLATSYSLIFKYLNLLIYVLSISIISSYVFIKTRKVVFSVILLILALSVYGTTPRLLNNFNNEALATLFFLTSSILLHESIKGQLIHSKWLASIFLGLSFGFLALTKAQFLYICFPVILVLFFVNSRKALVVFVVVAAVITPWIYRNYILFDEMQIAARGKTVAAVRVILTSEPTTQERLCMAYAFSHPALRGPFGAFLEIDNFDFAYGGKCQRLNRETCFDMGTVKVKCTPFAEDMYSSDYTSKIQYFYKGFLAGELIEKNKLGFGDIAKFDVELIKKYIQTLPLFMWRGFGFSDYPLVSICISIAIFGLLFTQFWPFAILCISSQLFHILLTHNIPRYHAVEFPVLVASTIFLLYLCYQKCLFFVGWWGKEHFYEIK